MHLYTYIFSKIIFVLVHTVENEICLSQKLWMNSIAAALEHYVVTNYNKSLSYSK